MLSMYESTRAVLECVPAHEYSLALVELRRSRPKKWKRGRPPPQQWRHFAQSLFVIDDVANHKPRSLSQGSFSVGADLNFSGRPAGFHFAHGRRRRSKKSTFISLPARYRSTKNGDHHRRQAQAWLLLCPFNADDRRGGHGGPPPDGRRRPAPPRIGIWDACGHFHDRSSVWYC